MRVHKTVFGKRRLNLAATYAHLYLHYGGNFKRCHYCGGKASSIDHIPALNLVDKLGPQAFDDFITVYACIHCNSLLSNLDIRTIAERKEFLRAKLEAIRSQLGIPRTEKEFDANAKLARRILSLVGPAT